MVFLEEECLDVGVCVFSVDMFSVVGIAHAETLEVDIELDEKGFCEWVLLLQCIHG